MIETLVPRASSYAGHIDWLFTIILVTVGFWFLVAQGVLFYFIFRFRRRDGVGGQYVTGELKAEKKWISHPHHLVILCDVVLIVATVYVWTVVKQDLPPAEAKVRIVAQQWAWTFQHPGPDGKLDTPDDITTVDELHLRLGTVYHFELTARDVLHSFSVPVFRLKQDAVPGRTVTGWVKPTLAGTFDIQCAEICGIGHGLMPARMVIESAEAHDGWMRQQRST
jgi:cytochrome c oxidase subunit 2